MGRVTVPGSVGPARPTAPLHPDGTPYRYDMLHAGGARRTYADEPAELLAALLGGYAEEDVHGRTEARIRHAVSTQVLVQAALNVRLGLAACSPHQREALTGDRAVQPVPREPWTAPVPLVLIDCFYAPTTDVPRPTAQRPGEIWWLDPRDEWTYLVGLHELGVVHLSRRDEDPEPS
ncbi:hypothetical protein [Streptomyces sp. NPDC093970]|uniref:hypothetical protein n=1 Tax=Streptomyces sp. NPDC093970 TaxID=3155076 RepID=UPI0034271A2E